jgi:hypothetical protein
MSSFLPVKAAYLDRRVESKSKKKSILDVAVLSRVRQNEAPILYFFHILHFTQVAIH